MASTKPALAEWIPKSEAARLLGVGMRQIERREQNGLIEKRTMPRLPTESTGRVLYSRADVAALKAGTPNMHARPVAENRQNSQNGSNGPTELARIPAGRARAALERGQDVSANAIAGHLLSVIAAKYAAPPAPKPWLTLDEAYEYSGLPKNYLLAEARAGRPFALNVGDNARPRWRFNREALGAGK